MLRCSLSAVRSPLDEHHWNRVVKLELSNRKLKSNLGSANKWQSEREIQVLRQEYRELS